jgi:signal transduction histidine kinase/ligand-binding sensor domain-containing protein
MARRFARTVFHSRMILALAFCGGLLFRTSAAPPGYFVRTWQVESGLPQNKVTAILQTRDGYLWMGTYNGLARFDGVHFTVFDDNNTPQLHSSRITSLCEAKDGTLWIGDESGQLTQYKDGQFTAVPFRPKWSGGKIYRITTDESQDVWLMNETGELARARDGLVLVPPAGAVAKVVDMARSENGTIWVERAGAMSVLQHGRLSPIQIDAAYIQGICAGHDGGLWVAGDLQVREWKDGKWMKNLGAAPWGHTIISQFIELKNGMLAAGSSDSGLFLLSPNPTNKPIHFDRTVGFPSDWVISLWQDREGNLWSGTGAGLVMARPSNLETISPPDEWQGRAVLSVCADTNNALWIGTEGAGLYHFQNGTWTNFDAAQGIRNPYIWSLAEDSMGRLCVGTWGGGLFMQGEGTNGNEFGFALGMNKITPPMPSLLAGPDDLWIGTTEGLLHYQNGDATWFTNASGKFSGDIRAIAQDEPGAIWVGTAGSGLACLKNEMVQQFRQADGLSSDFIECLRFDEDGTLWIGTFGGGLNRFKNGHFSVINSKQGLPNNVICDIETDGQGYFWMSSYGGIIRVSQAELNECADGKLNNVSCLTYGINDGLPTLECSEGLQPAGCQTADGRLWFPTAKGLVSVDPANVTMNPLPPPVVLEQMRVDDQPCAGQLSGDEPIKISPGRHRFDFQYTGLSFVAPEKMQFKCRLNGIDNDWVDVGTKRTASYNYIPPGNYSFQVTACNNDGVWNQEGASITFRVLPYFWQTLWFRFVVAAALIALSGGLVWFVMRRRMQRKLERLEWQRAVEHERARIAHDIHDDLGAHLTRISMLSETARGELDNPERAAAGLNQIYNTAHELTRAMDEIVWAVNPRHDSMEGLVSYLEKFAQDLLAAAGIRCRLDMPLEFPSWRLTAEVRHNLFLAFKEALHNVAKHSAATETSIRLVTGAGSFELVVEDNGRGFTPGANKESAPDDSARLSTGNGLENMARRMAEIHGRCQIQSTPGQGTKVIFIVPLNIFVT